MPMIYNATVTLRVPLTPNTMVLRVALDEAPLTYEAGQYTILGLLDSAPKLPGTTLANTGTLPSAGDSLIRRAYTITSNSRDKELEFVITIIPSGELTPRLFALKEGSRLFVEPKAVGTFTLRTSSGNRDLMLIATGTALAPYLSMIRSQFPQNPEHQYVIVHAAAVSWDLAFRAQMENLAETSKHLTYLPIITAPARDKRWHGLVGSIEHLLKTGEIDDQLGMPITPDRFDVYLAGNPQMIDAVTRLLEERGFKYGDPEHPDTNIHMERYW